MKVVDAVVKQLLAEYEATIPLDAVGEAIGDAAVTQADIEAIFDRLEAAGRTIVAPEGAQGVERLRVILPAARALRSKGIVPTVTELATATGLTGSEVRAALLLAKVMSRG